MTLSDANTEMRIRPAEPADVPAIEAIAVAAWRPYYAYRREILGEELFQAEHGNWKEDKARQVRENALGEHGCLAHVAVADGQVVGFVTFWANQQTGVAEIGNNAVHPQWQNRGIATRLYRFVLDEMRRMGMRYARVRTGADPAHAPARAAYEKVGFGRRLEHVEYHLEL